jgi:hypothetical protein
VAGDRTGAATVALRSAAGLVQNFRGARDAEAAQREQGIQIFNAATGFHLDVRCGVFSHENQVLRRGPVGREGGGGADPIGVQLRADCAEADLLFFVQAGVFKDELYVLAGGVGLLHDSADIFFHEVPAAALNSAAIDGHVQLFGAVGQGLAGFDELHHCCMAAVREPDCGASFDA